MRDWLLLFAALSLTMCPAPPPPPPIPTPPVPSNLLICSAPLVAPPTPADVCSGMFTTDGWACVSCAGSSGCIDAGLGIYCAAGPCTSDPACSFRAGKAPRR